MFLIHFNGSLSCERTEWSPTKMPRAKSRWNVKATGRSMALSHMSSDKEPQSARTTSSPYCGGGTSPYFTIFFFTCDQHDLLVPSKRLTLEIICFQNASSTIMRIESHKHRHTILLSYHNIICTYHQVYNIKQLCILYTIQHNK